MDNLRFGDGLFFKCGINSITRKKLLNSKESTPDNFDLSPSEQGLRPQLEQLLHQSDGNSFLEEKLTPDLDDRELLLPGKFQKALDDSLEEMEKIVKEMHLHNSSDANVKVLNRAVRVLREDIELRDLLRMYRAALLQG